MILVPATMELLGDRNWWLPKWLDRILPKLNVDGEAHAAARPAAGAGRRSWSAPATARRVVAPDHSGVPVGNARAGGALTAPPSGP